MASTFSTQELYNVMPSLKRFALSLTRNEESADDLVQDSVERALLKADYFEPGTNLRSWMFTLCRRLFLNQIRKQKSRGSSVELDDAPQTALSLDSTQEVSMECQEMKSCFERLHERDREVLTLIAIEGLKYEEAASVLDVPIGTVRSRLSRARSKLRELTNEEAKAA